MAEATTKKATTKRGETAAKPAPKKAAGAAKESAVKKTAAKKEASGKLAVIATGGKQYVVREGDVLDVEKLADTSEGSKVEFSDVLLVDDGTTTKVGEPTVSGAKVSGECVAEGRGKKISVIRFRAKSRYFRNKGHRQPYTRVKITSIK